LKGVSVLSVLKNKRGLSRMEFYHTARQLREDITNMLLRDFGVRDKIRKERTPENTEITIIEEYPAWLITYFRTNILNILFNLTQNITAGNSIYPVNDDEVRIRRQYQTDAISNCEQLLNEMQFCADVLPVKLEKFMPFVDKIDFEIALLRGWRKSSNRIHKNINKTGGK
jgi:hypothetical protein